AIERALDIVNPEQSNKGVKVNLLLNKEYNIYGLMNEFVQVLVSILSNANDIIKTKKLSNANISVTLSRSAEFTTLCIADNCGGIDDENLSKIFDPYFTTKHKSMGTGLGLHIAKMIIEDNMRGFLSAKNIYDNDKKIGAEFIIKIQNEN
ncbi:MAG: two-component system, NtrC family, C4-dicarboxylate transport sensor histidine kinase DctB, partial [Campylobacterota bacterium]|nr:two-component system, NtrC family, C4-dicarboxylate transport sensor histidine kinase DctB [Campylobacterota bacterium]